MPNPYDKNDKAAAFVDYYASDRMLKGSVDRLYRGGVARQQQARAAAEQKAYPERFEAPTRRTQAEIDNYLQNRVEVELLRRQQRRAALQRELHPEVETPPQYLSKREMEKQVRRLYADSMRRRKVREQQIERTFGRNKSTEELVYGDKSPREVEELKQLEAGWRPPSASVPHESDNRVSLVSQYEYYANPKKFSEVFIKARSPRAMTAREKEQQMKRLTDLSRPLSVTPKRVTEGAPRNAPPPFYVHRKVDYEDGKL